MYARFSKFEFWLNSVTILGHVISKDSIQVDSSKIEIVQKWSRPSFVIEIQSFLGSVRNYRCLVKDFSNIATLLTRLTRKHVKYEWLDSCEESFQKLKACLTLALVLALVVGSSGFEVYCDASRFGLGYVYMARSLPMLQGNLKVKNKITPLTIWRWQ